MKKKVLALLTLLTLTSALFAGGAQEEAPVQDGVVSIKIVAKDFPDTDPANIAHLRNIEAGFEAYSGQKIALELVSVPEGAYGEKLNLMLLAGNIPDLIYFQGGDEVISKQGLLVDLGPYVKSSEVMQDVLMGFNKDRLANYPYLLWLAPPRARTAVIREDWFNEAGAEIPVSVDDYTELFRSIKNNHPEAYVMTDTGNTGRMDFTFNHAFGMNATWVKENGAYVYNKVSEGSRNKLAYYQKMYAEGILDPEYITTKWDTMEDKLYTNQVAMVYGTAGIVLDIYNDKLMENQGVGVVALPPAKGIGQGYSVSSAKETRGWAISTTSKNPDTVFELLEFLATDEGQTLDRYGVEGTHYNVVDGKVEFTEEKENWWPHFHEVMGWDAPTPLLGENGLKGWEFIQDYSVGDPDFPIPEELSPTWDALENLYKEYSFKIISGEYSIDKFDEFVSEWYDLGGSKVTDYANEVMK